MLEELLERSAGRFPDKTALVCGEQRLTYREVEERANRQAHQLIASGVKRGDRVAICMENSPQAVIAIFSVLKAGAVFLMIHPATKPERLQYILNDCSARLLSTEETGARFLSTRPRKQGIDIDLAALIYTSGSTGLPKGVMLTHLNMQSTASSIAAYLKNTETDIVLNVLPLSFGYGLYQLLVAFQVGAMLVLEKSFTYPFVVVETILRERVTGLPLVPTIISILLQMDLSKYQIRSLRYITSAAAALPVKHIEKLRALFPGVDIFSMYGLTECQRASYLDPAQIDYRPGSVGRGMPNEEVYIVDERGKKVGPRVTGELVIRGSNVMRGYWNLPVETDQVLRPGPLPGERVLYSGDLFYSDEEGYLYFAGRKDDIIKSRGEKVSPREVESVLCGMSQVAEAAVIGVPDATLGHAVQAFVVLRDGELLGTRQILRYCAEQMQDFMVPKFVSIVEALPKSPNGKIDRLALRSAQMRSMQ